MNSAREKHHLRRALWVGALLAVVLGCSTDSPTAPQQQPPAPPPGPSASWDITVTVSDSEAVVGSQTPLTVRVRVRRVSDGTAPPSGTTVVLSTSLGEFDSLGSQLTSVVLSLLNGRADVLYFPGNLTGTALFTAQLESSVGRLSLPIVDALVPVVASFTFQNSDDNFIVTFVNTSTGDPTEFRWDFGDGTRSREENPTHRFPGGGDYVVALRASKPGSVDTVTQIVAVSEDELVPGFEATVDDLTVVFRDTTLGEPTSWFWSFGDGGTSILQNPTHTYEQEGAYVVTLEVRKRGFDAQTSQTVTVTQRLFIALISPPSGPAGGGNSVTINGQGFKGQLRVLFGSKLATVTGQSSSQVVAVAPPGDLVSTPCDDNDDGTVGLRTPDLPVAVTVELASGAAATQPNGYTYLSPSGSTCVGD